MERDLETLFADAHTTTGSHAKGLCDAVRYMVDFLLLRKWARFHTIITALGLGLQLSHVGLIWWLPESSVQPNERLGVKRLLHPLENSFAISHTVSEGVSCPHSCTYSGYSILHV